MARTAMIFYFFFFPINDLALIFSDNDDGSETLLIVMTRAAIGLLHFFFIFSINNFALLSDDDDYNGSEHLRNAEN
jgi:hypothetical protein